MRILALYLFTILLGNNCNGQDKLDINNAIIEYVANSRGFYQKIQIQNHMILISKDRSKDAIVVKNTISESDWNEIKGFFENLELESLVHAKAPTDKRFYDGAAIASLKITYKGITYESTEFDHGFPPESISKFVNKINSLTKDKKQLK